MAVKPESPASLKEHHQALMVLLREFDRVCKRLNIPYVLFAGTMLGAVRHQGFIPWDDDLDVLMQREDYDRFLKEAEGVLDEERFYLQREFTAHWPMFFSKLRLNGTACIERYHPKDPLLHQGVYIDIFPCDRAAESLLGRRIQFYASKVVIAKSLWKRGYETDSLLKKTFMGVCRLLPRAPFVWIAKRGRRKGRYLHSFFGAASGYEKNVYPAAYFEKRVEMPFEDGSYPLPAEYEKLLTLLYGDYMRLPSKEERAVKQHAILVDLNRSYEDYWTYSQSSSFEGYSRSIR